MKKSNALPYFVLASGVLFVSFSAPLIRLTSAPPAITAFYRLLFTLLILLPFNLFKNNICLTAINSKHLYLSLLSGFALAIHFISWITSVNLTSIASSTVIVNTQPLLVVILAYIIWKEYPHPYSWPGGIAAILGTIFLSYHDFLLNPSNVWGDLLAFLGAIAIAVYYILGKYLRQYLTLAQYTTIVYLSCTLVLLLFNLGQHNSFYPYTPMDWLVFLSLAFFSTVLGHTVINWTLKYLPATTISISILGEPAYASIIAWAFLSEPLDERQISFVILIITGLAWFLFWQKQSENI